MTISIIVFGSVILFAGVLLLIDPEIIFGFLRDNIENIAIHLIAVIVRLIIGTLLITQSGLSRFPLEIEVLGWVFIFAGFSLAVIGHSNFRKLMNWVLKNLRSLGRLAGVIAIAFGGLLIYAFL